MVMELFSRRKGRLGSAQWQTNLVLVFLNCFPNSFTTWANTSLHLLVLKRSMLKHTVDRQKIVYDIRSSSSTLSLLPAHQDSKDRRGTLTWVRVRQRVREWELIELLSERCPNIWRHPHDFSSQTKTIFDFSFKGLNWLERLKMRLT